MSAARWDCLCAGIIVADYVSAPVAALPEAGQLVTSPRLELSIGGCASNVAVNLARLGRRVAVAGTIGADPLGRFIRESLAAAGVDGCYLVESPRTQTSGTLVINVAGEDRRFIHAVGANAEFTTAGLSDPAAAARVVYLGGYCLAGNPPADGVAEMFAAARAAGAVSVLDVVVPAVDDYWPRLIPVLPLTDVFLPNDDEARVITGRDDPLEQAAAFHAAGATTVVITRGGRGAVLVSHDVRLRAGVHSVDFVDGTGAGDAFAAGYIDGLLQGGDAPTCLRLGTALGASCVRATGATTGVFTADELADFVRSHELPIEAI